MPELLQILLTLNVVIKPSPPNLLDRDIVILNFVRRFRNFIADTVPSSCKSALNPPVVCSTDHSKAVVPVLVLLLVALWFVLRGDLLYVFPCVVLFLCFLVLLVLRLPRLGKREQILVLFLRLFGLCLFRFVGFLFLLWENLLFRSNSEN